MTHTPRGAARTLARGWSRDSRRWTVATTAVLASTLTVLLATSGIVDGTAQRTLDESAVFYTGKLRITPSNPGALPHDWFPATAAQELRSQGLVVSARVESNHVMSRRGFADAYVNEDEGVPIGLPGSDADPRTKVNIGALIGLEPDDPARRDLESRLVAGRLPRDSEGAMEIAISESEARAFLSDAERSVPGRLLDVVGAFRFDVSAVALNKDRVPIVRDARVVGLFATGIDMLDAWTVLAPAGAVRGLMDQEEAVPNVLLVQSGDLGAARSLAASKGWATQGTEEFASFFVGQLVGVLRAVAWLVSALLFLLPTALIGHGLARQLAGQHRELAVATAIGVPRRTLADALSLQVLTMAAWAVGTAAVAAALLAWLLPMVLQSVPAPLPLGFRLTWRSVGVAAAVTVLSIAVGLWVGMRSRARLPLAASLRAA